jgi:type II secretory pathway pseudopilin PulG
MQTRARDENGFGMLELLMAMVMLNVGILAVIAAFSSGNTALARGSRISTAAALADVQIEAYRGLTYDKIVLAKPEWDAALLDSPYTADKVYVDHVQAIASPTPDFVVTTPCPTIAAACDPSYTTTGADHRSYRVDTYIYYETPASGAQLKVITVVVRNAGDPTRFYARVSSTFDPSTIPLPPSP